MKKIAFTLSLLLAGAVPAALATATLFSDVEDGAWYYEAVKNLNEKGLIKGYEDGTFKPSDNVNRAELAVTLDRLISYLEDDGKGYTLSKIEVTDAIPSNSDGFTFTSEYFSDYYFLDGDILYVNPTYAGGCADHSFKLEWDGKFQDAEHTSLHLIHNANGETCRDSKNENLKFDLGRVKKAYMETFDATEGELTIFIYAGTNANSRISVDYVF